MTERLDALIWVPPVEFMREQKEFVRREVKKIGIEKLQDLVSSAIETRENAYTPYSHYFVGAAVLTESGKIFGGCNSEGVNYSTTVHAEGLAIATANAAGEAQENRKYISALAVVHEGDSGPCGECLQRIVEHADNCLIIVAKPDGEIVKITSLLAIFPYNFNPSHLEKD